MYHIHSCITGYRDAQVGWVEVREDEGQHSTHSKQTRIAQFLVIYAARRGILEVGSWWVSPLLFHLGCLSFIVSRTISSHHFFYLMLFYIPQNVKSENLKFWKLSLLYAWNTCLIHLKKKFIRRLAFLHDLKKWKNININNINEHNYLLILFVSPTFTVLTHGYY